MLAERRPPKHEYYLAILVSNCPLVGWRIIGLFMVQNNQNDRASGGPAIVASSRGGMNIEDVAKEDPSAILTLPVDYSKGISRSEAEDFAKNVGFKDAQIGQAAGIFENLYRLYRECDATQVEINPLAATEDGAVLCMDAKLGFDDNAEFRQGEIFALRDRSQEDSVEVEAAAYGLNFIKLDGNVGCLVNGAGLAMAT
jgi:succinyl-CoA synthetase beta subunit